MAKNRDGSKSQSSQPAKPKPPPTDKNWLVTGGVRGDTHDFGRKKRGGREG